MERTVINLPVRWGPTGRSPEALLERPPLKEARDGCSFNSVVAISDSRP